MNLRKITALSLSAAAALTTFLTPAAAQAGESNYIWVTKKYVGFGNETRTVVLTCPTSHPHYTQSSLYIPGYPERHIALSQTGDGEVGSPHQITHLAQRGYAAAPAPVTAP